MDKIFIEQAKNIRRQYIKVTKDLSKSEEKIGFFKEELRKIKENLSANMNEDSLKISAVEIEKNLKLIQDIIEPLDIKVKKLQEDADKLFENIKERYPNMSSEEIQNELIPHLEQIRF
jgi:predicted transcriptional regulator